MALSQLLIGLVSLCLTYGVSPVLARSTDKVPYCPVFYDSPPPRNCQPVPETFLDFISSGREVPQAEIEVLEDAFEALAVLQQVYFDSEAGTWPLANDWTAAVHETVMAGTLTTLTKALGSIHLSPFNDWTAKENLISFYYSQLVGSYFGQDILSIRGEAYDDILWVVLGWLEAVQFVTTHSELHYPAQATNSTGSRSLEEAIKSLPWHGNHWMPAFAHRSRVFWGLATSGWGDDLCHGGMTWNPRLRPYKNAITNELWISASVSMYQYFPGDNYSSPFVASSLYPSKDPAHLAAAIVGYKWLKDVNMTNARGLYVDGYHIDFSIPGNVECDMRDEMVYTYNQGVILTGQRGLYSVTGSPSYLEEGHNLIQSVINATGWSLEHNTPHDDISVYPPGVLPPWHGLGRGGVLEEQCDSSATCSQDSQTFKAIYFHHLVAFCTDLEPISAGPHRVINKRAYQRLRTAHIESCRSYLGWVHHNVLAAMETVDLNGQFGMWWGAGLFNNTVVTRGGDGIDHSAENVTDYRNQGTPNDEIWGQDTQWLPGSGRWMPGEPNPIIDQSGSNTDQQVLSRLSGRAKRVPDPLTDPNSRGRGRTGETQIGGLALLRAFWELSQLGRDE
uniref:Glycosyl hydrolase n=1 Tax=Bionectria ochroleuca TaxID=29856 RepID=A0A8H7NMQ6_BIOOC